MAADESTTRWPRSFFRSWPLIVGCFAAIALEVLVLFGLRPLSLWVPTVIGLIVGGAVLARIDVEKGGEAGVMRWIAAMSLVVSIASLLVAVVTYTRG